MESQSRETERYLHDQIPLSKSMQVSVVSVDETGVLLAAPLAPNVNHRGTVFGGSASALAMIACWTLIHLRLRRLPYETSLVIRRNSVEYFAPLPTDFEAFAQAPEKDSRDRFLAALAEEGKGRLDLTADIRCQGGNGRPFHRGVRRPEGLAPARPRDMRRCAGSLRHPAAASIQAFSVRLHLTAVPRRGWLAISSGDSRPGPFSCGRRGWGCRACGTVGRRSAGEFRVRRSPPCWTCTDGQTLSRSPTLTGFILCSIGAVKQHR